MATVDFTQVLKDFEEKERERMSGLEVVYDRVTSDAFIPDVELEMYVNPIDSEDVYLSPRSVCEMLGLGKNWLNTSFARPAVMAKLKSLGFGEKRMIAVSHSGNLTKKCVAIDKADFKALMRYAKEGGKPMAIALSGAFIGLGLISSAGLGDLNSEEVRVRFRWFYKQMIEGAAKNACDRLVIDL